MKNWIVPGIIILGILIFIASLVMPTKKLTALLNTSALARVIEINGTATTQGLDEVDTADLKKETLIKNLDLIKTESDTEVTFLLSESQGEFRLLENAEALIEEVEPGLVLITLRQGDLLVDHFGKKPSFLIRKEGKQLSAMDYALSHEKNVDQFRKKGQLLNTQRDSSTLTQLQVEEILSTKKSDFFRCYGQLIQKTEQAHGQVILSFEISNMGKITKIEITKSDIDEPQFKSCLSEVIARTQFPRFKGNPMTMVFPLKFE